MKFVPEAYQGLGRDHLHRHDRAGLFAGIGLGKTATTLSVINDGYLDGDDGATLVVAPLRVARLTWPNEAAKWDQFRWMKPEVLRGQKPSGKSALYTINYERLTDLQDLSFCKRVVFDESTRAKNPDSIRIKHIKSLFKDHQRWILTGTPRPNSLLDLFAQIRLLDDGKRLSPSFNHFRQAYFTPIDYHEYNWVPKPGAEERIYQKISDLCLTLRSSDYLDIADAVIEDVEVPLSKDAHAFYKRLERELFISCGEDVNVVAPNAAALVNKLLQVTGGTVYTEDRQVIKVHAGKLNALKRILADTTDNVMVGTNYIHERERIVAEVPGAVDASKFKGDIEDAWNSKKIRCLVADPRSLGHGLNLQQGGHTIIWFSPTYSREQYDQFNGRICRKGQKGDPMIYRILTPGTIDDAVCEALREKGDGQKEMLRVLTEWRKLGRTFHL